MYHKTNDPTNAPSWRVSLLSRNSPRQRPITSSDPTRATPPDQELYLAQLPPTKNLAQLPPTKNYTSRNSPPTKTYSALPFRLLWPWPLSTDTGDLPILPRQIRIFSYALPPVMALTTVYGHRQLQNGNSEVGSLLGDQAGLLIGDKRVHGVGQRVEAGGEQGNSMWAYSTAP